MKALLALVVLLGFSGMSILAQSGFGSISGRTTDPSGAAIVNAKVRIVNTETNIESVTATSESGYYYALQLQPGKYRLEVSAPGFQTYLRDDITVSVQDRLTLDVSLTVGQTRDTVTVTGEAPLLRTTDAQLGEVINTQFIQNLPQLNRDPLQLLTLAGNVQGSGGRADSNGNSDTRINGGRTLGLDYIVDGVSAATGLGHLIVRATPTMEATAEVKVITNGISAEYGRTSGGVVQIVTVAGTNQFHGQAFDYIQNDILNANSWSQNTLGGAKAKFRQNIFGGALSGPIWIPKFYNGKDRTFFTLSYEGTRRRNAGTLGVSSVPTEAMRNGDFSGVVVNGIIPTLYDQNSALIYNASKNEYRRSAMLGDGKHIPASMISPAAKAILSFVPLPNRSPRPGTSWLENYVFASRSATDYDQWSGRVDQQITTNQRFFGRYTKRDGADGTFDPAWALRTVSQRVQDGNLGLSLNYDWTKSPTFLTNIRAGVFHNPYTNGNLLPSDFTNSSIPFDATTRALIGVNAIPTITIGVDDPSRLANAPVVTITANTTYDLGVAFTKIKDRQTIKWGVQHRRYYDNVTANGQSKFNFSANPVNEIAGKDFGNYTDTSAAYGPAAFLIGVPQVAQTTGATTRANAFSYYAAFVQDDFKLSPKWTLNLGLRWDMESPLTERFDKLYFWDPEAAAPFRVNAGYDFNAAVVAAKLDPTQVRTPAWVKNGFLKGAIGIANTPEYPSRKVTGYHPAHFAPRLGAAYQVNSNTVVRASFGQMYLPSVADSAAFSSAASGIALTDSATSQTSLDNLLHLYSTWEQPYLPGDIRRYSHDVKTANYQASGGSPNGYARDFDMPYEFAWSLGIQREISPGWITEATYTASMGRKLIGQENLSSFPRDLLNGGAAGTNGRVYPTRIASPTAGQTLANATSGSTQVLGVLEAEYPYYGAMTIQGLNIGRSNYQALNLRTERRMWHGFTALFNYTFSKSLDNVGSPNNGSIATGYKRIQGVDRITDAYGYSPLDETHVLRGTYNWDLPVGRGRRLLGTPSGFAGAVLDSILGGWGIAGTGSYRSGRPIVMRANNRNANGLIGAPETFGSYATASSDITGAGFTDASQVFYSSRDPRPANLVRRFGNVLDAQAFIYGTLPSIFGQVRNPSKYIYDMSLMKAFYFSESRRRYVQFRMEGTNIFNIRGFGNYTTDIGTANFGLITSAGNQERRIQMSARIVF